MNSLHEYYSIIHICLSSHGQSVCVSGVVHAGLGGAIIKQRTDVKVRRCRPRTSSPPTPIRLHLRLSRCVNFDRSKTTVQGSPALALDGVLQVGWKQFVSVDLFLDK